MMQNKILLVEDDNLLRTGLKSMLEVQGGFIVEKNVATGREALQICRHHVIDIVILDLRLPDEPGTVVLKKIKEIYSDIKVIILTSHDDNELIFETLEYGAMHTFSKVQTLKKFSYP
jgi:DNA-binding NarL/FixJ family response regulator